MDAYTGGRVPCLGLPGGAELRGQNEAKTYKGLPLVVSSIWNEAPFAGCDELVSRDCLEVV